MKIHKLKLKNFRNHKDFEIDFSGESHIIVGANGAGKSNILESIYLLSTTKSPHADYDRDMINHEQDFARVEANITNHDDAKLEFLLTKSEKFQNASSKRVKVNNVSKMLRDFSNVLNSVLFSPPDIELFSGSPAGRRKYMDLTLSQIDVEYKRSLADYKKAIRQRNKLLEQINEFGRGRDQMPFWNEKVLKTGITVQNARKEFFDFLGEKTAKYGKELNNNGSDHKVVYDQNSMNEERLDKYKEKEVFARKTLVGPHRDDFHIKLDNYPISSFGSRGQQRAALLALKIAELDFITKKAGKRPVLLLDDIFSELDEKHKKAVFKIIDLQQTIITSAEPLDSLDIEKDNIRVLNI